ncbi:MAG: BlaI/MecI/CopY family transcriptional regulator [Planctomycetota bacterium]|jgi:predicted transcriptional regulator
MRRSRRPTPKPDPAARPTAAELAILNVLWDAGPSTVRQVHDALPASIRRGYTTTLKLMQIMAEKELVYRDESGRSHVYSARTSRRATQSHLVGDLVDRAFGGSSAKLVLRALSEQSATPDELAEIRSLLERLEEESES